MADLVNEFSWSNSKYSAYEYCARAFWNKHYGSWGGWDSRGSKEAQQLYLLKNLKNRRTWPGTVLHDEARLVLQDIMHGREIDADKAIERAKLRMRQQFAFSVAGAYRASPKKTLGLVEHELKEVVAKKEWTEVAQKVERAIRNLFDCDAFSRALSAGCAAWRGIESKAEFMLDGIRIWIEPDFAFSNIDGYVEVVDWKTGKPNEDDARQIVGYAAFAEKVWKESPWDIQARLVYLSGEEPIEVEVPISSAAIRQWETDTRGKIDEIAKLLVGADIGRNLARKQDFPMTEHISKCAGCEYRVVCGRQA